MIENKLRKNSLNDKWKGLIKTALSTIVLLFCSVAIFAQSKTITGVVTDDLNETLIGASISVKNTSRGTVTNIDGNYSVSAEEGDQLVFSYIGMLTQTITVGKSNVINVKMEPNAQALGEVVVEVGYGKMKKRDLTGSIVSVSGDALKNVPTNSPMNALQGKVAGLNVITAGGAGNTPKIQIRGVASTKSDTSPIFVVDGMILDNIDFVNPTDIQSIEVLKDPSSLAIFGMQGANGVIIVTTNRPQNGATLVKYDGYAGVQHLFGRDRLKLTDATEFTTLFNEQRQNQDSSLVPWEGDLLGKGTDWQDEVLQSAFITNHYLSVSSASEKSSSLLSVGYFKQDGIVKYNSYQKFNINYTGDIKVNDFIKMGAYLNGTKWDKTPETANIQTAARAFPTYSPYAPESNWDPKNPGSYYNPSPSDQKDVGNTVATMELLKDTKKSWGYRGTGNAYIDINFMKDFSFKVAGYFDVGINYVTEYTPIYDLNTATQTSSQQSLSSNFSKKNSEFTKYQADFILNYNKEIDKHTIGAMVGYTAYQKTADEYWVQTDSIFNNMPNLSSNMWILDPTSSMIRVGPNSEKNEGSMWDRATTVSYISRLTYAYDHKYLLTATLRRDGTSKFNNGNAWDNFPSIGLGWIMSEEQFMQPYREIVDFLKVKSSWGRIGNDKIQNYVYTTMYNPQGTQVVIDGITYYLPTIKYGDKKLRWEIVEGFDLGVDASLFHQRLSVDMGFYTKDTKNLLTNVKGTGDLGASYELTNVGTLRNSGFEFVLGWRDQIGGVRYHVNVNGATLKNKVISLGGGNPIQDGKYSYTQEGHSVGAFYGYVQDGIFQNEEEVANYYPSSWKSKPGDIRYKDVNGDKKIDVNDMTYIGSPIPTFTYGINLGAEYKNFDFSIGFNGVSGNKIINDKKLSSFTQFNYYEGALKRWHGEGTSNFEPILDLSRAHNQYSSTNLVESGAYFRIKEVQLGYTIPKPILDKMGIKGLRLYLNAQNLITFKNNTGYTPEIGGNILAAGIDEGKTYPLPTTFTGGLTLSF